MVIDTSENHVCGVMTLHFINVGPMKKKDQVGFMIDAWKWSLSGVQVAGHCQRNSETRRKLSRH